MRTRSMLPRNCAVSIVVRLVGRATTACDARRRNRERRATAVYSEQWLETSVRPPLAQFLATFPEETSPHDEGRIRNGRHPLQHLIHP